MKAAAPRNSPVRQWKWDSRSLRRRPMHRLLRLDSNLRPVSHLNLDLVKRRRWNHQLSLANRPAKVRLKSIKVWDASA